MARLRALSPLAVVALLACVERGPNPHHCWFAKGDATCAEQFPSGVRLYCTHEDPPCNAKPLHGCVPERPERDECYSPCGGGASFKESQDCEDPWHEMADTGEIGEETTTGDGDGDGDGDDDGDGDGCSEPTDCPDDKPFCTEGTCSTCDDTPDPNSACANTSDGETPICDAGSCVQCTEDDLSQCSDDTPVCDSTNTCVPCTSPGLCPGGAGCHLPSGECLPADAVFHVDADGGQDFETIQDAVSAISNLRDKTGTIVVHERDDGVYENTAIQGELVIAIYAPENELVTLGTGDGDLVALTVQDSTKLHLHNLHLTGVSSISSDDAEVHISSCRFSPTSGTPITLQKSHMTLKNSTLQVYGVGAVHAIDAEESSSFNIAYSTIISNDGKPLLCDDTLNDSEVRNSLLLSFAADQFAPCDGITYTNNALESLAGYGPTNTEVGEPDESWFVNLAQGDLHLSPDAPDAINTAAKWALGDPTTDIDGEPRPTTDGAPDVAGADVP